MSVNPQRAAKFSILGNKGITKVDADQLPLSALTGFDAASDSDTGIPSDMSDLAAESLALRVGVRYTSGTKIKTGSIWMTVEEIGKGSIRKLTGKSYKGGVIRSAKVPQKAVAY